MDELSKRRDGNKGVGRRAPFLRTAVGICRAADAVVLTSLSSRAFRDSTHIYVLHVGTNGFIRVGLRVQRTIPSLYAGTDIEFSVERATRTELYLASGRNLDWVKKKPRLETGFRFWIFEEKTGYFWTTRRGRFRITVEKSIRTSTDGRIVAFLHWTAVEFS